MTTKEEKLTKGWLPFAHGETALDFGSKYLFANPETREIGIRWAHAPPPTATWCIKLNDVMSSIPAGRTALERSGG